MNRPSANVARVAAIRNGAVKAALAQALPDWTGGSRDG